MSPLSDDSERRRRQLSNLRPHPQNLEPGAGAWAPGASPHLKHGLRSRTSSADVLDPVLDVVLEDLEAKVPVRDEHGDVPAWLREACWAAAVKKLRVVRCARFLAQHRDVDERGRWRPENAELVKATDAYERSLAGLAMTVTSHMRAGADRARASLAEAMSEADPERRRRLYREAGLDDD